MSSYAVQILELALALGVGTPAPPPEEPFALLPLDDALACFIAAGFRGSILKGCPCKFT